MQTRARKGGVAKTDGQDRNVGSKYSKESKSIVSGWDNALARGNNFGALMHRISHWQSHRTFGASNEESENTCILI